MTRSERAAVLHELDSLVASEPHDPMDEGEEDQVEPPPSQPRHRREYHREEVVTPKMQDARAARAKVREHEERAKKRTAQGEKSHTHEVHGAASSTSRGSTLNQMMERRRSEIEEMLAVKLMVMGDDVHDGTGVSVDDLEVVGFHGRVEGQLLPPGVKPWRPPQRASEPMQEPRIKARTSHTEVRVRTRGCNTQKRSHRARMNRAALLRSQGFCRWPFSNALAGTKLHWVSPIAASTVSGVKTCTRAWWLVRLARRA
jgi:hypothetical protein